MRPRMLVVASLMGAGVLAVGIGFRVASFSAAQPERAALPAAAPSVSAPLPIAHVVLFSSGVGYFQREGEVQGNSRIDLSFPTTDVNDLLKSMVLQDLGGGRVSAVSYDSHDPIEKTLKSYAINLTSNPTFGQILNQARGEKVETVLQQTQGAQPGTITGVILGVEKKREAVGKEVLESEMLNLWCAEGLRSVRLSDVQRLRFLNPVMDSEVKKALETLALSHDTQKKTVSLNFSGEGRRTVKVGYVVENPIWKTSYRLVLDKKGKPFLQGWAMVENTQDEDWNNVRMGLISGRPISFQMDLYQPLYVKRPVVEPELFASLRPPTYSGAMEKRAGQLKQLREEATKKSAPADKDRDEKMLDVFGHPAKAPAVEKPQRASRLDPTGGVSPAVTATELGDYFQYAIEHPVTLPRQKSAMLPIINQEVEGEKVSIYNEGVHSKFALLGLKFKNTTPLHLSQGPITVFEGSSYAGDARILDLQPKDERLISYAIDLGTEVEPVVNEPKDTIVRIKLNKGLLEATHLFRQSKTYNVKNRSEQDRVLLIEHPFDASFKLIAPNEPTERARDVYRFQVKVKAKGEARQEVIEESQQLQQVAISNFDDEAIKFFVSQKVVSEAVKKALREATTLKHKIAATQQDIAQQQGRLDDIRKDQQRLRENLKTVPPESEAYKRYVKKFDTQETEIEQLQDTVKKLQEKELQQRKDYDAFLANLTVE
jgi:hypothetical protein